MKHGVCFFFFLVFFQGSNLVPGRGSIPLYIRAEYPFK